MVDVPSGFVEKVKTLMSRFLWSGRNPKVKYQTIIGKKNKGGLDFPDVACRLETQGIMFVKKLVENGTDAPWKHILLSYLDSLGGPAGVRSNFNVKLLPKNMHFYIFKL